MYFLCHEVLKIIIAIYILYKLKVISSKLLNVIVKSMVLNI